MAIDVVAADCQLDAQGEPPGESDVTAESVRLAARIGVGLDAEVLLIEVPEAELAKTGSTLQRCWDALAAAADDSAPSPSTLCVTARRNGCMVTCRSIRSRIGPDRRVR